ncbi:hypothetical protein ROZALSC1DRAFT_30648 [Rozella allomycis CSF55]|uniref:Chromo shadow domain-containing protein n=1 Tax=Rozella allomycis (strain CSF55) TaxID=988480 RepID=A0A075APT8_ROZAC|nr:hypothetical protein O9G_002592 [Rozella allomycis CSF55]RKP17560.1 hypothetical protein ROZALSC1DRAFT_30648 [Rozella allomycis CSF55]|eukprot:EPZ32098.1 hypothetical protein O9G_002592 [Rozella allomycis CSF55]
MLLRKVIHWVIIHVAKPCDDENDFDGNWEDMVESILTLEHDHLKNLTGRVKPARFPMAVCKEKCPQKLLSFYENFVKFKKRDQK